MLDDAGIRVAELRDDCILHRAWRKARHVKVIWPRIGIAVLLSLCVAVCADTVGVVLYERGHLSIDVGDAQGHGPDRGPEWDHAAKSKIRGMAIGLGAVSLCIALAVPPLVSALRRGSHPQSDARG